MPWGSQKPQPSSPEPASDPMDRCDRCQYPNGLTRVGKYVTSFVEVDGELHGVHTQPLDLVFCAIHFRKHEPALRAGDWRVLTGGVA